MHTHINYHTQVVNSPISNSLITIKREGGSVIKFKKLLLQILLSELHNYLLDPKVDSWVLIVRENVSVIISETNPRKLLPLN